MLMDNYGISEVNPIQLRSLDSVTIMLHNIVTESGFHLLYHFKDYILKPDSIIVVIEVFSGNMRFYLLYFDISNEVDIWIAPSGFLFFRSWIECKDGDFDHDQDYYLNRDESPEMARQNLDIESGIKIKYLLLDNYGFMYRRENFPDSVYREYQDYDYGLED